MTFPIVVSVFGNVVESAPGLDGQSAFLVIFETVSPELKLGLMSNGSSIHDYLQIDIWDIISQVWYDYKVFMIEGLR
ncbi:MAG: hypothetical protein HUJ98_10870 [Bacteroidaceae bacterium]|nr:hypothetical protein [Bacteroidaceae bacterium]